ncbi:MAG TPA: lipocalin-like domain-containing protein [Candidatus Acidoferrum sp.]|nr:lipocalin-like domain-containing protein [Candidatus Acidoferrum sp.]
MRSSFHKARAAVFLCVLLTSSLARPLATRQSREASSTQFQSALPGYRYEFPRDYFNHAGYQTEWWYYTGNLQSGDGRKFGFELTFFRQALSPRASKSTWDPRDIYFAHFALSDLDGKRFFHTERTNRAGPAIAGASASLGKVWNGNWSAAFQPGVEELSALAGQYALQLRLRSQKPPVIHGTDGVSQKSAGPGRASHYFSQTRLHAEGTLVFDSKQYRVTGLAWMDHEFFTHQLDENQTGWDWLSLQLDDNTELMLFHLRQKDGSIDPFSAGTFVDEQGKSRHLTLADFQLQPGGEFWTSRATSARYPVRWTIAVPSLKLTLQIKTPLASQELVSGSSPAPSYWEGAVFAEGTKGTHRMLGSGYLEMTGYDPRGLAVR